MVHIILLNTFRRFHTTNRPATTCLRAIDSGRSRYSKFVSAVTGRRRDSRSFISLRGTPHYYKLLLANCASGRRNSHTLVRVFGRNAKTWRVDRRGGACRRRRREWRERARPVARVPVAPSAGNRASTTKTTTIHQTIILRGRRNYYYYYQIAAVPRAYSEQREDDRVDDDNDDEGTGL